MKDDRNERIRQTRTGRTGPPHFAVIVCLLAVVCLPCAARAGAVVPKNVIFFIGDGMGPEQVKAARYYNGGALSFETLPHSGLVTTYSADSSVTDSAAAATALATGYKANNGVISEARPANAEYGFGEEMETLLEYFQARGKSAGLVSTTYITHATPAAFGAHEPSRGNYGDIADDYVNQTRPNVLFGGSVHMPSNPTGYTVVTNRTEMQALNTETATMVSGQFGSEIPYEYDGDFGTLPHLSEMTETALAILDNDSDGFFLMVEGGKIDWAGHDNHLERNVHETLEFGAAVQEAVDWATGRTDTLILVTADHETGGMTVLADNGADFYPTVSWAGGGHTAVDVPVYARGVNAYMVSGVMDNTDMFAVATIPEPSSIVLLALGCIGVFVLARRSRRWAGIEASRRRGGGPISC